MEEKKTASFTAIKEEKKTASFVPLKKAPLLEKLRASDLSKCAIHLGMGVDPDGMACQATMAAIIEKLGGTSDCFYKGTFDRPQNKLIKQLLNLNTQSDAEFNPKNYSCIIVVDGPAETTNPYQPDFIIDHHEQNGEAKLGSDVRPIGACSSIVWEYAIEAGLTFNDELGQKLATALAIGIKTDTKDGAVESACNLDFEALSYCLAHKDNKLYKEILNYSKPAYYHDLFVLGWTNKVIESAVLVTGIGPIPAARSGIISDLAEKFCETEGIHTTVVFGIVDGSLDISVRSKNAAINVDEFVKKAFGGGGGKNGAGRVKIPTPLFEGIPEDLSNQLFDSCFRIVKYKALHFAGDKH